MADYKAYLFAMEQKWFGKYIYGGWSYFITNLVNLQNAIELILRPLGGEFLAFEELYFFIECHCQGCKNVEYIYSYAIMYVTCVIQANKVIRQSHLTLT